MNPWENLEQCSENGDYEWLKTMLYAALLVLSFGMIDNYNHY